MLPHPSTVNRDCYCSRDLLACWLICLMYNHKFRQVCTSGSICCTKLIFCVCVGDTITSRGLPGTDQNGEYLVRQLVDYAYGLLNTSSSYVIPFVEQTNEVAHTTVLFCAYKSSNKLFLVYVLSLSVLV